MDDKESFIKKATTSHYWNELERKKWTLNLCIGSALLFASRNCMSVCVPVITKELGWTKEISGMALSSFYFGYLSSNIFGGHFADKYGGAKMILYSSLVWAILTMFLPLLASPVGIFYSSNFDILALRFFTGISQGFFFPSFVVLISKFVRVEEKGLVVGIVYSGCAIGIIMTGFVGSLLIENGQWQLVFIICGLISLLWLLWFWNLKKYLEEDNEEEREESMTGTSIGTITLLKVLLQRPCIWAVLIAYSGSGISYTVLNSWTPVYFHDMFPESKGWVFNVVPWLGSFTAEIGTGYIANRILKSGKSVPFLRKFYAALLFLGTALFSLLLTPVSNFTQALVLMSLIAAFSAFGSSSISMNPQDLCPKHSGFFFGFANSMSALGGTAGVYLTGIVLEKDNNWTIVFICNALISVLSFLVFQIFGSTEAINL